jgi:VanZ family protein
MLRWLTVVLWAAVIFALSSIPSLASPFAPVYDFVLRKCGHMGVYAVLTILLFHALQRHLDRKRRAWLCAALLAGLYALSDEWHQTWIAGRSGSFRDVGIDALGIATSYALIATSYALTQRPSCRTLEILEGMMSCGQCPACQNARVNRSRRRGLLEWLSRPIHLVPFRCEVCNHRFLRFTWRRR